MEENKKAGEEPLLTKEKKEEEEQLDPTKAWLGYVYQMMHVVLLCC